MTTTEIFVFGSNLAGRHGKGAALEACRSWGAQYGVGRGKTGYAYAIPTKDAMLSPLPLEIISFYVQEFIEFARSRKDLSFRLTPIGCGLAGYTPAQIAPMFRGAPPNVVIPDEFKPFMET